MIVVSEMGEQWSPHTAPAMQAEMAMIISSLLISEPNTFTTIGIRIPKVPHEVPVANARNAPTRNAPTTNGSSSAHGKSTSWNESTRNVW